MAHIREIKRIDKRTGKPVTQYRVEIRRIIDGKPYCKTKIHPNITAARKWLAENDGAANLQANVKQRGKTFSEVVELFVKTPPMKGTKYWLPQHLAFWKEQLGHLRFSQVTHGDINMALAVLQTRKAMVATPDGPRETDHCYSPGTINRFLASLRSLFNFAMKQGMIDNHPMKGGKVEQLEENNERNRVLTDEEEARLLQAAKESRWPMMHLLLRLAFTSGARKDEVRTLKWQDVYLDKGYAELKDTKTKEPRILPLVGEVRAMLEEARKVRPIASDYVFFDPKHPARPKNIEQTWLHVRERAGLLNDREDRRERVVFHTSRHTAITRMLEQGASIPEAALVSGHKTWSMLKRYEHMGNANKAVELAERLLAGKGKTAASR